MFRASLYLSLLFLALPSCEERQDIESTSQDQAAPRRSTRNERQSFEGTGRREEFRNAIIAAKKRLLVEERDRDLLGMAWKALETDLDMAGEAILEISPGTAEKKILIEAYIQTLVEQGRFAEAETWASSLDSEMDRQAASSKITELSGLARPEEDALRFSESHFSGEADPAAVQVIQNWVVKDPNGAAEWLRKMPEGEARANGFRILLGAWVLRDTPTALSWISSQPNPQLRQEAMSGITRFLSEQPPSIRVSLLEGADEAIAHEILNRIAEMSPEEEIVIEPELEEIPHSEKQSLHQRRSDDGERSLLDERDGE